MAMYPCDDRKRGPLGFLRIAIFLQVLPSSVLVSSADAQLMSRGVGRGAYKPSQYVGSFDTGVVNSGTSQAQWMAMRNRMNQRSRAEFARLGGTEGGVGYARGRGYTAPSVSEQNETPMGRPSTIVRGYDGDSLGAYSRSRGNYGYSSQRYVSPSVVDILARGGGFSNLPPAPIGDKTLEEGALPLPRLFEGEGSHLENWANTTVGGLISTGQAQLRKKEWAGARHSFELARLVDPNAPDARVGLVQIELMMGNYNKATQMIRDLGNRCPQALSSRFDISVWHESTEAYDEFLRNFRQQVAGSATANEMVSVLSAYVAWTTGDVQVALSQIRQAARLVPHEQAWVNLARALESLGALPKSGAASRTASVR